MHLEPVDQIGRVIQVGEWVRLVIIPPDVGKMPAETRSVFRRAVGKTFMVEDFNEYGLAELDLSKKVERYNTIWVEPEYLLLFRRGRKQINRRTQPDCRVVI